MSSTKEKTLFEENNMGAGNLLSTRKKAFDLRKKAVDTTYTVRVGATGYNFLSDRVITITNPTAGFTITVPPGSYFGQELLISLLSNDSTVTVIVSKEIPTGVSGTVSLLDVGDFVSMEYVNDTAGWILLDYIAGG